MSPEETTLEEWREFEKRIENLDKDINGRLGEAKKLDGQASKQKGQVGELVDKYGKKKDKYAESVQLRD